MIANTPKPPYASSIFTSIRTDVDEKYDKMDELTFKEIETIKGYLGCETFRDKNGFGVNLSYWKDMNSLKNWKENTLHKKAQILGKEKWYKKYKLRICTVERDYEFVKK
tara:strand:+ start:227 stop:553 length:327 start_codon:yes stop_codon:yes gene_type:complete